MDKLICFFVLFLSHGLLHQTATGVQMAKLAGRKQCADKDCSYVISMAEALEDYVAPDCRFINLKKGQMIYIYSKLKPAEGAGVFWSGSVYGDRYVDQMGVIGYFPRNYVNETQVFEEKTMDLLTKDMDFFCA